jgi:hypothetical protein
MPGAGTLLRDDHFLRLTEGARARKKVAEPISVEHRLAEETRQAGGT